MYYESVCWVDRLDTHALKGGTFLLPCRFRFLEHYHAQQGSFQQLENSWKLSTWNLLSKLSSHLTLFKTTSKVSGKKIKPNSSIVASSFSSSSMDVQNKHNIYFNFQILFIYMHRETITYFSAEKIISTNPRCVFKTEIVENSETTVAVILGIKIKAVNVLNYF